MHVTSHMPGDTPVDELTQHADQNLALRPAVYREVDESNPLTNSGVSHSHQSDTNMFTKHHPPSTPHAMLLPRLGCGSPAQMTTDTCKGWDLRSPDQTMPSKNKDEAADLHDRIKHTPCQTENDTNTAHQALLQFEHSNAEAEHTNLHAIKAELPQHEEATHCQALHQLMKAASFPDPPLAKPLPRLGCGGPSRCTDSHDDASFSMDDTCREVQPMEMEGHPKRHCSAFERSRHPEHDTSHKTKTDAEVADDSAEPRSRTEQSQPELLDLQQGSHSPITVISDTQTVSDTMQFQPVLKGVIKWTQYEETFWFAADLPGTHLERVWELGPCCQFSDLQELTTACLMPMHPFQVDETMVTLPRNCVQVLMDEELTLLKVEPHVALLQQPHILALSGELYDQFGLISQGQTTDYGTILLTEPITYGVNVQDLVLVFAAFDQTQMRWHVCRFSNRIVASFAGPDAAVNFLRQFFMQALTAQSLHLLGRKIVNQPGSDLVFEHSRLTGIAPPNSFLIAIAIAAAKTLMDCLETTEDDVDGRNINFKWAGRPVWKGKIHGNTTLATLECLLRHCLAPWGQTPTMRILCQGKQQLLDHTIQQLPQDPTKEHVVIHAIMALRGGGQGTKVQQRAVQQNALASTLLDHGFNLAWTTKAVDTVMEKFGLGKLQAVNAQPMGSAKIQAAMQLCKDAGITIPDLPKPKSGNDIPGNIAQKRKKRTLEFKLNPSDYTLVEGFFTREDGTVLPQVNQIVPHSCGICIQTPSQAEVWVREGQKISVDELGLLVLGPITVHSALTSEEITFPSLNSDRQMVLITATLVQLGAKAIQHKQGDPKQVPSETCSLMAVTMYKEDWQTDDWTAITTNPVAMVRKLLEKEGLSQGIQAVWGKSLRHNRAPATPIQASTVQVHMTVEDLGQIRFQPSFPDAQDSSWKVECQLQGDLDPRRHPKDHIPVNQMSVLCWPGQRTTGQGIWLAVSC